MMVMTQSLTRWSRTEDKLFEQALVLVPEEVSDRWQRIGEKVGKSPAEVKEHYDALVRDVYAIDCGRVELPSYVDDLREWEGEKQISFVSKVKNVEMERKKGIPWTEEEHKKFLIGLQKFGKGDWRSISRKMVITRTPTQVASHAQKYFLRHNSRKKERKRSSIHDITTVVDQKWPSAGGGSVQQPPALDGHQQEGGSLPFGYENYGF